jgi:O-antigen/teichoic acid export membrane protein
LGLLAATMVANLSMVVYYRVLSQRLGLGPYAQVVALMAVLNVLSNVTLGLNTYLVKAFSADVELKGPGAVKGRLLRLLRPGLISLGALAALLALLAPWLASYLKLPGLGLALTIDLLFAAGVLLVSLRSAQQGLHHFGWLGLSQAGEGLTRVAVVLGPVNSVEGGLFAMLLGQLTGGLCALGGLLGLGPARPPVRRPGHGRAVALREGLSDSLALTLLALLCYLDVVVLKHYYPDERAGLYSRAALVAKSFLYLPSALNMVLLAAAAREVAGGRDPRRLLKLFLAGALALDAAGLAVVWARPAFCLGLVAGFDPRFATDTVLALIRWFSLAVVPLGLLQMVVAYLLAIRRRGIAVGLGVLALLYFGLLRQVWNNEFAVVASLGACSSVGLAVALGSALLWPPKAVRGGSMAGL